MRLLLLQTVAIGMRMALRKGTVLLHCGMPLVLYVAFTLALSRPVTIVPGSPSAVTILSYRPLVPGQLAAATPHEYVVVRDAGSIRQLVREHPPSAA